MGLVQIRHELICPVVDVIKPFLEEISISKNFKFEKKFVMRWGSALNCLKLF